MRAIALLLLLVAAPASAQPATFYGPDGRVVGSAVTIGRTTSFYGPGGRFEGSAVRIGNGASFYGFGGHFRGSVIRSPSRERN
jgi:hypothetical protein